MYETDPDVGLMLAFRAGDEAAFDALFRRWSGPLSRFLERMVGDFATAEELVQEAFLRVHRARDRYSPDARFSTWLYRIASNLALNELRRPRRRNPHISAETVRRPGDEDDQHGLELADAGPPTDDVVHQRRRGEAVARRLAELPDRQRMALWLSSVEGLTYAEVAEVLDTSTASVKALVHRARSTLVGSLSGGAERVSATHDEKKLAADGEVRKMEEPGGEEDA